MRGDVRSDALPERVRLDSPIPPGAEDELMNMVKICRGAVGGQGSAFLGLRDVVNYVKRR